MSMKLEMSDVRAESGPVRAVAARGEKGSRLRRLLRALREECGELHLRLALARILTLPLPPYAGNRLRAVALRMAGFSIGSGTVLFGMPRINGSGNLHRQLRLGRDCVLNVGCYLDVHAEVSIGDRAGLGQEVMLLTHTHDMGPAGRRFGGLKALPVRIGEGAWVGARCTILPGVTIGEGAVVAAGSIVNKDVPPNVQVAGVPARVIRELE